MTRIASYSSPARALGPSNEPQAQERGAPAPEPTKAASFGREQPLLRMPRAANPLDGAFSASATGARTAGKNGTAIGNVSSAVQEPAHGYVPLLRSELAAALAKLELPRGAKISIRLVSLAQSEGPRTQAQVSIIVEDSGGIRATLSGSAAVAGEGRSPSLDRELIRAAVHSGARSLPQALAAVRSP